MLNLAKANHDREQEITTLNNLGSMYFGQGQYGEALQRYQSAADRVAASTDQPWYRSRRQLTDANLAVLYQRLGQYNRALALYRELGPEREDLPTNERAQMLSNMGTLYRRLGDPVSAVEQYRAAQQLFHKSALLAGEIGVLNNIGITQTVDDANPQAAAQTFTQALVLAEKSAGKRLVMTSALYRGEAYLRAAKPTQAAADFETATSLAKELKAGEEQWKAEYGLARVADLLGDRGHSDALLNDCIAIIEALRKGASASAGRTGFLIDKREVYDLLIGHEASAPAPNVARVFELMEQSRARALQDRLSPGPTNIASLQARLPSGTLILEYWVSKNAMVVLSITHSQANLVYRTLSAEDMRILTELPSILADPTKVNWEGIARSAGQLLLRGVLPIGAHVLISPDGALARIPFEALPIPAEAHTLLIDHASVSYLPFAAAFRPRPARRTISPPWRKIIMAFADPAGKPLGMAGEQQATLPAAAAEIRYAASAVGGRASLHFGDDARKSYLREKAFPPLLHFATHAFADPEDPDRSYVLLAGEQSLDYLFLREAAGLSLQDVSLVTVSACDSGTGKFTGGEGVQNFGLAFLTAGAKAAVTSLWRIGDRSSAELVDRFYDLLASGNTAQDALREAKLEFRRSNTTAAMPAYWAGLILTGDGDGEDSVRDFLETHHRHCIGSIRFFVDLDSTPLKRRQERHNRSRVLIHHQPQNLDSRSGCQTEPVAILQGIQITECRKSIHDPSTGRQHDRGPRRRPIAVGDRQCGDRRPRIRILQRERHVLIGSLSHNGPALARTWVTCWNTGSEFCRIVLDGGRRYTPRR